jgi:hypothetical protein
MLCRGVKEEYRRSSDLARKLKIKRFWGQTQNLLRTDS